MVRRPRYPSDLTDAQWALLEPLLPPPSKDGRRPKHRRRDLMDAILYVDRTGCAGRALPVDVPPGQTVDGSFARWQATGVTKRLHDGLRGRLRAAEGRHTDPTAGAIDSQSGHGADPVGRDSTGDDAGKKTGGRKRFIVTDTLGLLLTVLVCAASVADRQGGGAPCSAGTSTTSARPAAPDTCSPTAASPASWWTGRTACCASPSRSCASPPASVAAPSSAAGRSWSGPSPSWPPTAGWPATTSGAPPTLKR